MFRLLAALPFVGRLVKASAPQQESQRPRVVQRLVLDGGAGIGPRPEPETIFLQLPYYFPASKRNSVEWAIFLLEEATGNNIFHKTPEGVTTFACYKSIDQMRSGEPQERAFYLTMQVSEKKLLKEIAASRIERRYMAANRDDPDAFPIPMSGETAERLWGHLY